MHQGDCRPLGGHRVPEKERNLHPGDIWWPVLVQAAGPQVGNRHNRVLLPQDGLRGDDLPDDARGPLDKRALPISEGPVRAPGQLRGPGRPLAVHSCERGHGKAVRGVDMGCGAAVFGPGPHGVESGGVPGVPVLRDRLGRFPGRVRTLHAVVDEHARAEIAVFGRTHPSAAGIRRCRDEGRV